MPEVLGIQYTEFDGIETLVLFNASYLLSRDAKISLIVNDCRHILFFKDYITEELALIAIYIAEKEDRQYALRKQLYEHTRLYKEYIMEFITDDMINSIERQITKLKIIGTWDV